jgi:CTP:molybdopterin cytidylyltransferase MocA
LAEIAAIILAAGKGTRIGGPKGGLRVGDTTFLDQIARRLAAAGIDRVVAVVPAAEDRKKETASGNLRSVANPYPERGMIYSVRLGVGAAGDADGYLVMPVDHPHVESRTYGSIMGAFDSNAKRVVRPEFKGKPGHPVIIPRVLAKKLPPADLEGGLAAFIRNSGVKVVSIPVDDPGVLRNINTREDFREVAQD